MGLRVSVSVRARVRVRVRVRVRARARVRASVRVRVRSCAGCAKDVLGLGLGVLGVVSLELVDCLLRLSMHGGERLDLFARLVRVRVGVGVGARVRVTVRARVKG